MDGTQANLIGTVLEQRYRVDAQLARGGMSSVYRGVDTRLDRAVAIKIMDPKFADDRSFVDRFQREARSAASLHHPNVVAVHDQGAEPGPEHNRVFLVMELVDGGTLRDLLTERNGSLPVPLALSVIDPVLAALSAAHGAELVHRDVKPENVLIGRSGTRGSHSGVVKVADFGLVRAMAGSTVTSSNVILGTVAYLSPEQVTTGVTSAQGDVYSAGVLLYEMLTGDPPYTGDTALSVAYQHVNSEVPAPSSVVPAIPPALDELVLRATRRDPAERPDNAEKFRAELEHVRTALGITPVAVPVPVPDAREHTTPVSASTIEAAGAGNAAGVLPVDQHTVPAAPANQANSGPRGTKALLREPAAMPSPAAERPPPDDAMPTPPHGLPQPPPDQQPADRRRKIVLWSLLGALLLGLIGAGTWWFVDGRYVSVPEVTGFDQAKAEQTVRDAGLTPKMTRARHNSVKAGTVIRSDPASGQSALRGDEISVVVSMGKPTVPDISPGTSLRAANSALRDTQLRPVTNNQANAFDEQVPKGAVLGTDPGAGTELNVGTRVTVILSKGPPPKPVPQVAGMSQQEAFQAIRNAGMRPYVAGEEFSADVDGLRVVRTDPAADTVPSGDKRVGVFLSTAVTVPDLTGQTVADAQRALRDLKLTAEVRSFLPRPESRIVQQKPPPGSRVEPGSTVILGAFP
ncbi:MAG: Stk1 family PASTA domain-containing Ser/Thr kinase [Pseudonocardiaceae bacterium]|nr:Stk1 family PASTA domain-containing Ser/Thr kinase [Pseudonocardiaceae bacterium]